MITAWLIGSYAASTDLTVTIAGSARTIDAGTYYLYDPNDDLSLLDIFAAEMALAGLTSVTVTLRRDRKVTLAAGATFAVTWTDTRLRDLLGYTGNLSGASSYHASLISPLLWSPGRTESPREGVLGSTGARVRDAAMTAAPQRPHCVVNATWRENTFEFGWVASDRYMTASELAGEYHSFFDQVVAKALRFKLYRGIDEDGTTSAATLFTPLGPYVMKAAARGVIDTPFGRSQGFEQVDVMHPVSIACRTTSEIVP